MQRRFGLYTTGLARGSLLTTGAADRFLLLDAPQLALGNVPALAANRTQNSTLGYLFTEAFEQLILRFIWT